MSFTKSFEQSVKPEIDIKTSTYIFLTLENLIRHLKFRSEREVQNCQVCNEPLCSMQSAKLHKIMHSLEKSHSCELCKLKFNYLATYTVTRKENPFSCDVCNETFSSENLLKKHFLSHTNNCQYVCEICNKNFSKNKNI
ncbi:UNVERIFIED_CONTAM: zinc finger protein 19 [Trichonephila clavipes]